MNGVVGLTGYARSGKDTVADILVSEFDYVKLPFAGPLKAMAQRINPIIGSELEAWGVDTMQSVFEGNPLRVAHHVKSVYLLDALEALGEDETKSRYPEYRRFLQHLGTDGVRHLDDDFWIIAWWAEAFELLEQGKNIVVPDVRFPNEADAIREIVPAYDDYLLEGVVARVSRAGLKSLDAHESEKHVGRMGELAVIKNDHGLLDLESFARAFAKSLPWA